MNDLEEKHELHLTELNARHREEKMSLQSEYQTQIEAKSAEHELLIQALQLELSQLRGMLLLLLLEELSGVNINKRS